jgi:hypothetical protein
MPDDVRVELEAAARRRGHNLTDELIGRLRSSFNREDEQQRDPVTRALASLISAIGRNVNIYRSKEWHRDPFAFRAFKLGVAKLLDLLEPRGEITTHVIERNHYRPFQTPESLADFAADSILYKLFYGTLSMDQAEALLGLMSGPASADTVDWFVNATAEVKREEYELERVRNHLQLTKKTGG